MTGFGRGTHTGSRYHVQVEIRSLNQRFRDINVRIPNDMIGLVEPIRNIIVEKVERGRVDVFVVVKPLPQVVQPRIDPQLSASYYQALQNLTASLGLKESPKLEHLLQFKDVIFQQQPDIDLDDVWADVKPALEAALSGMIQMRFVEGQAIRQDFFQRLDILQRHTQEITNRAPATVQEYRQRLEQRLKELLPDGIIDETRILTEVAIFAERSDLTEELVRLNSHLNQLRNIVSSDGPIGRKLEFLLQEIHREVNTIGSKSHDTDIASHVLEMKAQIEKLREQAQNVE